MRRNNKDLRNFESQQLKLVLWRHLQWKSAQKVFETTTLPIAHRHSLRARLHQASESTLPQLCDDSSEIALIENNGVTWKSGCDPNLQQLHCFQWEQYH